MFQTSYVDIPQSVSIGPEYQAVVPEYSDNNDDYYCKIFHCFESIHIKLKLAAYQ